MLTDEERDARIHGKPQIYAGQVFKEFDEAIHVMPRMSFDQNEYTFYSAIDDHPRQGWYVAWYAVNRKGEKFVIDELVTKAPATYKDTAIGIAMKEGRITEEEAGQMYLWDERQVKQRLWQLFHEAHGTIRPFARIMDTSAWTPDGTTGEPRERMLAQYGIHCIPATKISQQAITVLHDWLNPNPAPMLYFSEDCHEHIWQMKHAFYDDYVSDTAREKHDAMPEMRNVRIHFVALLKYLANYNPQYFEMRTPVRNRIREPHMANAFAGF